MPAERPVRILFVDDNAADRELAAHALACADFPVEFVEGAGIADVKRALAGTAADIVVTDLDLGAGNGLEVLNLVRAEWPDVPVMIVTGSRAETHAIDALHHGVDDFVLKGDGFQAHLPLRVRAVLDRAALRRMRDRLAAIVEASPEFIGWADPAGRIEYLNRGAETLLGRSLDQLRGEHVDVLRPDDRAAAQASEARKESLERGRWTGETQYKGPGGDPVPVYQTMLAHRDRAGRVTHISTVAHDLRPMRESQRWRQVVLDALPARIALLAADGTILETNWRWTEHATRWGCTNGGRGANYLRVCDEASGRGDGDAGEVVAGLRAVLDGRRDEFVHAYACPEPARPNAWYEMRATRAADGGAVVAHFDVSQHREFERRLDHLVNHDTLTGLPNRFQLEHRIGDALARARRNGTQAGLLFIDLNAFKTVNDSLGMRVGDSLLQAVAGRISGVLRDGDTLARLGGDEFAVLIEDMAAPDFAATVAEKLLDAVAEPMSLHGHDVSVSACAGIACFPDDADDPDTLLRSADTALHQAKASGPGSIQYFAADMNTRALETLVLQASLRAAIEQGQLVLHYQPIVDLRSGEALGVEALVRWQHPELGMVPPDRFIPIAEQTGLIVPLGEWVLREALRQGARWRADGLLTGHIAVNLSMRQFRDPGLARMVADALIEFGCPPRALRLELTESTLSMEPEIAPRVLESLHRLGVQVAVDDFGTGYSSLAYLKTFPLDVLKIDRSFVKDTPGNGDDVAIVRAIIGLAHQLGLSVVAEGVETPAQRDLLRDAKCDAAQGYLFSRPLTATACTHYLRDALPEAIPA